ncbi:MAG: UvrD-helicase domain-containing protein, partial [Armatimonadota bacterium]
RTASAPAPPVDENDPLLARLNPSQREAVLHSDGPLLIFAGAGSGKTRVLTHRIAYLIGRRSVKPWNILAVTFTNKAANEMRERLGSLLGATATKEMWVGTFHSVCARLLRERGQTIGLDRSFVVYDDGDQITLIKECLHQLNLDDRQYAPRAVLSLISRAKEKLIMPEQFSRHFSGLFENVVGKLYTLYQEKLKQNRALDFDDLILWTVRMLQERQDVREYYQNKFRYVLVDEYQDVNHAQYMLTKTLSDRSGNICVVGDDDQCLPPETLISTPDGPKPICQISEGDTVQATGGGATLRTAAVAHVHQSHYEGKLYSVRSGDTVALRGTPQHIVFARMHAREDLHYVYLMYRADRGFRIGVTKSMRRGWKGGVSHDQHGFIVRSNQEHADKMWILKSASSDDEARYWEAYFAAHYGLPTVVFHSIGREGVFGGDKWIHRLYTELDTEAAAGRLFADLGMSFDFPHHRPQGGARRQTVVVTMFGGYRTSRDWVGDHRIQWCARREDIAAKLRAEGFAVRDSKLSGFKMETCRGSYTDAVQLTKDAARAGGMETAYRARIAGETYLQCPLSHVRPGMRILTEKDDVLQEVEVDEISSEAYSGPVYDLEVERLHNYVAGGMLVHNSVYGWRGADVKIILAFERDYPEAKIIKLEQNYRSTQTILDAAYNVVRNNRGRKDKRLWTENIAGEEITLFEAMNEQEEGVFIATNIAEEIKKKDRRYQDFAVLYRTNAQSRVLEEVFINYKIPYKIIGGVRFYERREIKDIMAYLRLVHNPYDSVALRRVINVPARGIGAGTWQKIEERAQIKDETLWDIVIDIGQI